MERNIFTVYFIKKYVTLLWVIESFDHLHDGAFAGAGRAHYGSGVSGLDLKIHSLEHIFRFRWCCGVPK
jgi:hypothetical protein